MPQLNILSIAGSDPSGGAGVQRDLQVMAKLGCHGMAVITALTAQNSTGVQAVEPVEPDFLRSQLYCVFDDMDVSAVKIGMVGKVANMRVIADVLAEHALLHGIPVVLDPVMIASSGGALMEEDEQSILGGLKEDLLPVVSVLTPNIPEAEKLTRKAVMDLESGARAVLDLGARAVLLKGGHLKGDSSPDVLAFGDELHVFDAPRIDVGDSGGDGVRGTGCALSSALACYLAQGHNLPEATLAAKDYVREELLLP